MKSSASYLWGIYIFMGHIGASFSFISHTIDLK